MKSMKLSAIVLGLAAASVFAAPTATKAATAKAAAPAAAAKAEPAKAAAPAAAPAAAAKAEPAKASAPAAAPAAAAKAEPAKAAAPAAAPVAAAKADTTKAAAPAAAPVAAAKADTTKAAAPAPKAEPAPAPKAEPAPVAEVKADTAKAAAAEVKAEAAPVAEVAPAAAEEKGPEFKVSGEVEIDAYAWGWDHESRFHHSFSSTFDLNFDVKFNENWSAFVGIEADDLSSDPDFYFNGAYVQYQNNTLAVKLGDMTYAEGAFNYYRFDDATYYAAGMKEQNMRGVELDLFGIQAAVGVSSDENTLDVPYYPADHDQNAYFAHLAYDLEIAGQKIRPYVNYKGYDLNTVKDGKEEDAYNKLRAGVFGNFDIMGVLAINAGYGFYDDVVTASEPVVSHTFLIEPTLTLGKFSLTGSVFYALLADNVDRATGIDLPERFYIYAQPAIQFTDAFKVGITGEYHTNTLDKDNDNNEFAYVGPTFFVTPTKNIFMDFFVDAILPLGDGDGKGTLLNYSKDDEVLFDIGAEVIFSF